ncbi:hypothetical protein M413DRAFT_240034 [Hebeloma cylindrosporum]|uniref:Uncharacterized protein n=1 Tax=Hebeloma cylindrosporum TaxID=76867 RepID=A0A0C2YCD4_HEBCY|nr:hypothetical protein M413DRAFT_240034 [Hebeloma cylindrosporum h7]
MTRRWRGESGGDPLSSLNEYSSTPSHSGWHSTNRRNRPYLRRDSAEYNGRKARGHGGGLNSAPEKLGK